MKIKMLTTESYTCGIGIYGQREIKGLRESFQVAVKEALNSDKRKEA